MSQCGAYDKLFTRTLTSYRSLSNFRISQLPITKVPIARASTDRYPLLASGMRSKSKPGPNSSNNSSGVESQGSNSLKPGWRPYRGRWNAKVAYRDNRDAEPRGETAAGVTAHDEHSQDSRRGRPRQNQRKRVGDLNGVGLRDGQPGRSSSPRRDLPSLQPQQQQQPQSQWQNNRVSMPPNNGVPDFSTMNPFAMFGGFPIHGDPSTLQQPFFQNSTPDQLQQQVPIPFDPSLPNPAFYPMLGSGNPFLAMPPFLPPVPLMGFDMQNQADMNPMLGTAGQMGTSSSAGYRAAASPASKSNKLRSDAEKQAFKAPRPPSATKRYLDQAALPPHATPPRPLLVILDLNGTLIYRKTRKFPPTFSRRAGLHEFLKTLVEKYKVMIWSSSQPETVDAVCKKIFTEEDRKKLVVEWGRDKLNLSKSQYNTKVQVYKTLETVWSSRQIQKSHPKRKQKGEPKAKKPWDQSNTILIDDSKLKAVSEPYNLIEVPEFTNDPNVDESDIFPKVLQRLEILANSSDVSKQIHQWTSTNPETSILDLDLGPVQPPSQPQPESELEAQSKPPSNGTPPENGVSPIVNMANLDPRKQKAKERKQRKAARKAAAHVAANGAAREYGAGAGAGSPSVPHNASTSAVQDVQSGSNKEHYSQSQPQSRSQGQAERSPSPATSVASRNSLLDRLEESL
ncbi:NLI interacting factor-like phosphatase-domain-containing protein, partial [Aspergillus unguis]